MSRDKITAEFWKYWKRTPMLSILFTAPVCVMNLYVCMAMYSVAFFAIYVIMHMCAYGECLMNTWNTITLVLMMSLISKFDHECCLTILYKCSDCIKCTSITINYSLANFRATDWPKNTFCSWQLQNDEFSEWMLIINVPLMDLQYNWIFCEINLVKTVHLILVLSL